MEDLPKVTLDECPTGLFWHENAYGGTLGFKSEYATTITEHGEDVGVQCDAYVISSGEYFWGGAKSWRERSQLMVTPLDLDEARAEFWVPFAYVPTETED